MIMSETASESGFVYLYLDGFCEEIEVEAKNAEQGGKGSSLALYIRCECGQCSFACERGSKQ